jgi:hypothetical protein
MIKLPGIVGAVLIATTLAAGSTPSAFAASSAPSTKVVVPDRPGPGGGIGIGACYRVQERLYGPYSMNFCLTGRGSYTVSGGGLNCKGGLNWSVSGRNIAIKLNRTSCGRGEAWSADTMSCQMVGFLGAVLPKVVVPDRPGLPGFGDLRCTYTPQPKGYRPVQIRATRLG